ncbi:flagellar hook-associated protein FlgL [Paenibacillus sp. ACRRX]|uniref:flagellar hook-associated protein FlgL n=1 Tax=Paenibacillus sp. ACRRX TaxID=2918206 RepID=UPI001EF4BB25|nr:flagellar hook-associated protein FlgL [Paenibacillus sp. ACRRX]MCG7407989.1 flagellar hook-associated protein FlgL [Paenibacillus sp. ACRRX]
MRITQSMMGKSMMTNLQTNYKRLDKYQEQLMTNRRLNRPSDDPVGVASALHYRAEISSTTQFAENVQDADSFMKFTDSVINEATQVIQKLSELAVQGGTDTVPDDARENIAREVEQLYEHLVSLGNSQFKGKYIFNGQRIDQQPYPDDPANQAYSLDTGVVQYQVGAGIYVDVNTMGDKVFGMQGTDSIFTIVDNMKKGLVNDNTSDIAGSIPKLQGILEKLTLAQAEVGAKQNRLEFTTSRLDDLNLNYIDLQSKTEDINMPKTITELKTAESIFQASLDTIARISRPSLLDFLR